MEAQRRALDEQQAAWARRRSEIAEQAAPTRPNCRRARAEVGHRASSVGRGTSKWELQHEAALAAHSAEAERLAARQAELDVQRRALDEQQAAWETQARKLAERQAARGRTESGSAGKSKPRRPHWLRNVASGSCSREEVSSAHSAEAEQFTARQAELEAQRGL